MFFVFLILLGSPPAAVLLIHALIRRRFVLLPCLLTVVYYGLLLFFLPGPFKDPGEVLLHIWWLLLLASPFVATIVGLMAFLHRDPSKQPTGRCTRCGYLLRGAPTSRCPECGEENPPRRP
jgi:hypothetical protein